SKFVAAALSSAIIWNSAPWADCANVLREKSVPREKSAQSRLIDALPFSDPRFAGAVDGLLDALAASEEPMERVLDAGIAARSADPIVIAAAAAIRGAKEGGDAALPAIAARLQSVSTGGARTAERLTQWAERMRLPGRQVFDGEDAALDAQGDAPAASTRYLTSRGSALQPVGIQL